MTLVCPPPSTAGAIAALLWEVPARTSLTKKTVYAPTESTGPSNVATSTEINRAPTRSYVRSVGRCAWLSGEPRFGWFGDVDAECGVDEFDFTSVVMAVLMGEFGEPLADVGCVDR